MDPHHAALWDALAAAAQGGKWFRSALVIAVHDALGGTAPNAADKVSAALELLHTAFVIHDDIIDGDHLRRSRHYVGGTVHSRAQSSGVGAGAVADYGLTAAILAGDLALTGSMRAVALCGTQPERHPARERPGAR